MKNLLFDLKKKIELFFLAITFAEAGEWEIAEEYVEKIRTLNTRGKPKMMVITDNAEFREETVKYSVNLAERMNYDLLAIKSMKAKKRGSGYQEKSRDIGDKLKQMFETIISSTQSSKTHCETMITSLDARVQLRRLLKQIKQVHLVLIQVEEEQDLCLDIGIPVFQISPTGQS